MKTFIKARIPLIYKIAVSLKRELGNFSRKSYSQFGEDLVLSSFMFDDRIKQGFYVDVGSYHPKKYSNTNFYYKQGWSGINIDAKPGSMRIFKRLRKRDVNIESGISVQNDNVDFFLFYESAFNTFSKELADSYIKQGVKLNKKIIVKTRRLEAVLDEYLPQDKKIDFLTIDVEGLDLNVLQSNNWERYKPRYIMIEMHNLDISNIKENKVYSFLLSKGYKLVSIVYITGIFKYDKR